jgi:transposase
MRTHSTVTGTPQNVFFDANILGFSRRLSFWCARRGDAKHTYEGIIRAFEYFAGVIREVLIDNQQAAVIFHRVRKR